VLAGCHEYPQADDSLPAAGIVPTVVAAHPPGGYAVNVLTGDSLGPTLNAAGDTLVTGVPLPMVGKTLSAGAPPRVVPTPTLASLPGTLAHPNVIPLPKNLTNIPLDTSQIPLIPLRLPKAGDTTHYILTQQGDTLRTGVPVLARGETIPYRPRESTAMLPPSQDKNTRASLQYLTLDQGLPAERITNLYRSRRGDLWMTFLEEPWMIRYDGHSYTPAYTGKGWPNFLYEDRQGHLWFGSLEGIYRYDGQAYTRFSLKDGFPSVANQMFEDDQGRLWIVSGKGLTQYNGTTAITYAAPEGLPDGLFRSGTLDAQGNIWLNTYTSGVVLFNFLGFRQLTKVHGLLNNQAWDVFVDQANHLWIGHLDGGATQFDGISLIQYPARLVGGNTIVTTQDAQGNHWFASNAPDQGITRFDGISFTTFSEAEGVSSNYVVDLLPDGEDNLWLATFGAGLNQLRLNRFQHYSSAHGLLSNRLSEIVEGVDGALWIHFWDGNIMCYDGTAFKEIPQGHPLFGMYSSLSTTPEGTLWLINTAGTVIRYDGTEATFLQLPEGFINSPGLFRKDISMNADSQGGAWFYHNMDGLLYYDGAAFQYYTTEEGLYSNQVEAVTQDTSGHLWISYSGSRLVSRFDGQFITHYTEREGLSGEYMGSMLTDPQGQMWWRTHRGLTQYNGATFAHYQIPGLETEGLTEDDVDFYIIYQRPVIDSVGRIWIPSTNGLGVFAPLVTDSVAPVGESAYTYQTLGRRDGMQGIVVYSIMRTRDHHLWTGSYDRGMSSLDLTGFTLPTKPPQLRLNQLAILDEVPNYRALHDRAEIAFTFDSVAAFYDYPLGLVLPHRQNHLTFHFSAIDWAAPHNIRYQFTLNGLENTWSPLSAERTADYRNLAPGTYTFKVRAVGAAQVWSPPLAYTFTIRAPWYATPAAYLGLGLLGFLMVAGYVRWRTAQLRRQRNKLERLVDHRTEELLTQTEELQAQTEELQAQAEKLGTASVVAQQTRSRVLILDSESNVLWANEYCLEIYGVRSMEEFEEQQSLNVIEFSQWDQLPGYFQAAKERGEPVHFELRDTYRKDKVSWEQVVLSPLRDESGPTDRLLWVSADITELKATQDNLMEVKDRLQLINEVNRALLGTRSWHDTFHRALGVVKQRVAADVVSISLLKPNQSVFTTYRYTGPWNPLTVQDHLPLDTFPDIPRLQAGARVQQENAAKAEAATLEPLLGSGVGSYILFPLQDGQQLLGTLNLGYVQPGPLRQLHEAVIQEVLTALSTFVMRYQLQQQLEETNQNVQESINYAQKIQSAVLVTEDGLGNLLREHFLLFAPRDGVSGDFYWAERIEHTVFVAVADCTGHGIPGAMVSMICHSTLTQALANEELRDTGQILDRVREEIVWRLSKSDQEVKDGMDISLAAIDYQKRTLQWSGANNPLWLINPRRKEVGEGWASFPERPGGFVLKGDRQPVGAFPEPKPFTTHRLELQAGDCLYLFTDGIQDQFGGPKGRKFMAKQFRQTLQSLYDLPMAEQKERLWAELKAWQGKEPQVDDICVLGIRIAE